MSSAEMCPVGTGLGWSLPLLAEGENQDRQLAMVLRQAPEFGISALLWRGEGAALAPLSVLARYDGYPQLARAPELSFNGQLVAIRERAGQLVSWRHTLGRTRAAGLAAWIRVCPWAELPLEAWQWHPELAEPERLAAWVGAALDTLFGFLPELSGIQLVLTPPELGVGLPTVPEALALAAAPSVLAVARAVAQRHGRALTWQPGCGVGWLALAAEWGPQLPPVWHGMGTAWQGFEPAMRPAVIKALATSAQSWVELECAIPGPGAGDWPLCDPDPLWRQAAVLRALGAAGLWLRLPGSASSGEVVLETPLAINIWAACESWRLEPCDPPQAFDWGLWLNWASQRYGQDVAPRVVTLGLQTRRMTLLTWCCCGLAGDWLRADRGPETWEPKLRQLRELLQLYGTACAREEKVQAMAIADRALAGFGSLRQRMPPDAYETLQGAFERARELIQLQQLVVELVLARLQVLSGEIDDPKSASQAVAQAWLDLQTLVRRQQQGLGPRLGGGALESALRFGEWLINWQA